MKITNLKLTNFRNYEKLNLHFSNYKNIIIGNNGLGKTNIVEAIYYLSITKSFRTNNQEVLIRENSDFAVIEATVLNKIKNKYRVVITKDGKKIKIDNQEITKLSDYISKVNVVLFNREDMKLIKDNPSVHRKLINMDLSGFNNNYSNGSNGVSNDTVQQIVNAAKNTSVIRIIPGIDTISVDYVVYDPSGEYKSVFVEVENTDTSVTNIVYLSKTDTNLVIRDLNPNVYYNLKFKYTYYDDKKNLKEYTFDEVGLHTEVPKIYLGVTKIVDNKIYYKITFDKNYTVTGGTINLYLNDQFTNVVASVPISGSVSVIKGDDCCLDLSGLKINSGDNSILEMRLVNISFNTYVVNPNISYKFKY